MATPFGHILAGYVVFTASTSNKRQDRWTLLGLCLAMAIAPDFDFLPGILVGKPALYHQGISHSIGIAAAASLILSLLYSLKRNTLLTDCGWFLVAYLSHLVIDLWGVDARPPYGIPVFWPFSSRTYIAPWPIFPGVRHAHTTAVTSSEWLITIFQPANLVAISIEAMVLLPVIVLVHSLRNGWSRDKSYVPTKKLNH
jgi:inner membrane protein